MNTPSFSCPEALVCLGQLLDYPGPTTDTALQRARALMPPAAAGAFNAFAATFGALSGDVREELYSATFDITPACVPYLSIHLFGEENFKRAEFMAALKARYSEAGFAQTGELPDHLSNLLPFAALAGEEERRELVRFVLLGPLAKMIRGLHQENPYRALLQAVLQTLEAAYPGLEAPMSPVEQMARHGAGCAPAAPGCGCGSFLTGAETAPAASRPELVEDPV